MTLTNHITTTRRPPSDRGPRPSAAKATLNARDALHAGLRVAEVPLQLEVTPREHDAHGRPLFDVTLAGNRIVAASWVPMREAASALALDRWANASPVRVTDGLTVEVLYEGSLGDLGGFGTVDEAQAAERRAIRLEGLRDPRGRQRREGLIGSGQSGGGSSAPRARTLDRTGWLERLEAAS